MRPGICLLTLVPGVVGGSEVYARSLLRELGRIDGVEPVALLPSIAADAHEGQRHAVVRSYRASTSTPGRLLGLGEGLLAGGRLRRELPLADLDVVHFPLTVMVPRVRERPTVVSVLDLQHELLPDLFSPAERAYRRLVYHRSARLADRVVVISEHVKETVVERLGIPAERVVPIHLGADLARFHPGEEAREPFLLYPANRWPHKNHDRLFAALALLRRERPELRLVLTGAGHEGHAAPEGVDVLGRVPVERLAELYRRASALVYPSLYEGFGVPPIEAMASGCPVASSWAGSLREACGDAARLFDPTDPEAIAEAVRDVLADPAPWVARGLERAPRFTWAACARAHLGVYRELVG